MKTRRLLIALLAVFALFAAACGDDDDETTTDDGDTPEVPDGPAIKIGAQSFGESAILGEIYGQVLEANGYSVNQVSVGGFRDVLLQAYSSGDVNFSAEYAASMVQFMADEGATSDVDETVTNLQAELDGRNLTALAPSDAVNTNAFVVTAEFSESEGITKLSDLPADGGDYRLAAPQDCETNPFCLVGLSDVYGVDLSSDFTPLDTGLIATTLAAGEADIATLFSTDAQIVDEGWVVLEDDLGMLAADNVVPVVSDALIDAYGDDFVELVDKISAALDTDTLTELNKRYEIDKADADDIAADFIEQAGL